MRKRIKNRQGIAAVEAAVCLPLLIIVWLGCYEVTRQTSLRQQAQVLAATAADQVISSTKSFDTIKTNIKTLADSLGIEGSSTEIKRVDSQVVEATVSFDFTRNSLISSLFRGQQVSSTYYSYRED